MPKINIINIDDFARTREGNGYYADKTGFIEKFLQNPRAARLGRAFSNSRNNKAYFDSNETSAIARGV